MVITYIVDPDSSVGGIGCAFVRDFLAAPVDFLEDFLVSFSDPKAFFPFSSSASPLTLSIPVKLPLLLPSMSS